ncbi:adenosylcobinamide-GDP ribazoletransferase [Anderseniella sp. Alg231-50]|uniref:adenosylcobinamide-GDP ribazoletransferase n=1 Tax=Anderseniella sp. Alg231-50 TaxID=1922226 RepID=UPI000D54BCD1
MNDSFRNQLSTFAIALQFMTRLPGLGATGWTRDRERASVGYYAASGVVVGIIAALVYWPASQLLPPLLASLFAVAAAIMITGALHEDGLADICDGIGGGQTRDKALAIMKDSRIGAYGTLGLMVFVGAKVIALSSLPAGMAVAALVGAHATSRAAILGILATAHYARAEGGTASTVATKPALESWAVTGVTLVLVVVACLLIMPFGATLSAFAGAAILALAMRQVFMRKLGGYTGDCLGAVQQAGELGFYLGLAAWV